MRFINFHFILGVNTLSELCMTSNVLCQTVANYEDHHLKEAMEHDLPFTLSVGTRVMLYVIFANW